MFAAAGTGANVELVIRDLSSRAGGKQLAQLMWVGTWRAKSRFRVLRLGVRFERAIAAASLHC
jgi:hypothetical protein